MNQYDKYKTSVNEFSRIVPYTWKNIRLKYIGYLYSGLSGKSGDDFKSKDNINNKPFIPFTNIANNFRINPNQLEYVVLNENEEQNRVQKNDLFFMMSSENFDDVGKSTILLDDLGEVYLNSFCKGFRITSPHINPLFLNYLLFSDSNRKKLMIEANGFTRINLKMDKVNDFQIEIPSLEEQISIASYLDDKAKKIDDLIEKKQKLIELLKEERASFINQAVTKGLNSKVKLKSSGIEWLGEIPEHWEVKKLKWLVNVRNEEISDSDFKIAVENIESKTGKLVNLDSSLNYEGNLNKFYKSDIIFNKLRPYLHKVYFAEKDGGVYGELIIMTSMGEILPEYLFYIIFSDSFISLVNGNTQGTKMPRANWDGFINQIKIPYPKSLEEQMEIVSYINSVKLKHDNTILKYSHEIELLKEYRLTLINEVVTGKIKVI